MQENLYSQIPTKYNPKEIEEKTYQFWLDGKYFEANNESDKEPFTIVIPPPNVTANLHIGHALNNTLQDILIRWKRMQGYDALWLPGTDHAGIATQNRVENMLSQEGKSRYDVGREAFLEKTWEWKNKYGDIIINQLKKMGCSCDWSRERFTMDEGCSKAVREVFVRLYEKGLLYRGNYIVNWCPRCETTLSDIEVEHEDKQGSLTHIRYPVEDGSGFITVATTRPETMLGDVAVAVHPEDDRYKHLIGKNLILPLVDRKIPVIADEYVDKEFGSGAVKITPAHDPNDFEIGVRHKLTPITVMDEQGKMNHHAGKFSGLDRYDARKQVIAELKSLDLLDKVEDHNHAVGHCYRCSTVIEPYLSDQWFVKMQPLAEPAIDVVKNGDVRFVPERFTKIYLHWMENTRDWCVSRQLWWGHRIPAWYCQDCGEVIVSKETPTTCPKCSSFKLNQDEDVLDTWFSSALWPFSTLGWPDQTEDLKKYYPTDVLITGYDIIYFWVARMIFSGLEFMEQKPFSDVVITGLVRDAEGRKMSKSLGNGVDPLEVIENYGADAMRFMLATGTAPGNDQRFHWDKVESARNFANKMWNASRFVMMNLGDLTYEQVSLEGPLSTSDQWILHRLNETVEDFNRLLGKYEFGEAGRVLYDFIWSDYCDWYIELAKLTLNGEDVAAKHTTKSVLCYVLDQILKLLHPYMPYITEEIWQHIPHQGKALVVAPFPEFKQELVFKQGAEEMAILMDTIRNVRNIRAEMNVPFSRKITLLLKPNSASYLQVFETGKGYIQGLCNTESLTIRQDIEVPEKAMTAVTSGGQVFIPLEGLIDTSKEIARLEKEMEKLQFEVDRLQKKLGNEQFVAKAPAHVLEQEKEKEQDYKMKLQTVEERIAELKKQ
ncbi:valine--tRNA ligase [Desulfuribacillus stibiiarsenatis]|uniref:Valine--tRNA ligase n=1 Tax=Desulfuribacillus stibiiarsenatis TaxID=1390249 RepID=A0A1E5L276_9FIRM|nr:valine--tRNA ligase [Desulfuribacillus stibiiarsenatis]OEH84204.1 valine--tRNA ligase [Desulfuribacillus stibiiarsenatis]